MVDVFHQFKKRYGALRITEELNALGMPCSKNHIAQLLQIEGLKARNGKAFKYQSSASATYNVPHNLLARNFKASKPDEKWVSDISYIDVDGKWLHLVVIMDL